MGKNIRSTRCLFMGKIIRSTIDFLYVKGNRLSAHKLPMIRPPTGIYYLTSNVTLRQLVSGSWDISINDIIMTVYKCIYLKSTKYLKYLLTYRIVSRTSRSSNRKIHRYHKSDRPLSRYGKSYFHAFDS